MKRFSQYATNSSNSLRDLGFRAMSCLIGEPLATGSFDRNRGALYVINAKFGTRIHAKVELCRVTFEMLGIDVLVNANDPPLEDREKALKRIGMNITARPFVLGVVHRFMLGRAAAFENIGAVSNQAAPLIQMLVEAGGDAKVIKGDRADRATAFYKTKNPHISSSAFRTTTGFRRAPNFHIVGFDRLACAADRHCRAGVHSKSDAMPKVPRGFHAAAEHPLKLARRNTFLRRAKQMDGLQPQPQGKVAILENRTDAHRELFTARIALIEARLLYAIGMFLAWLRAHTFELADMVRAAAMRAHRTVRPKLLFDVLESGFLVMERQIGKDGLGHG